jgi:N-acyl amino acid synthase of PEP-CTERM/exosortase system
MLPYPLVLGALPPARNRMQLSNFVFRVVEDQPGSAQILEAIYRLRYQVYVNEWGFECPEDHPEGLEKDSYDEHSRHFYACTASAENILGTARIILGSEVIFPIEQHFDIGDFPRNTPRHQVAEISRLAISKEFRRREIDQVIFSLGDSHLHGLEQVQSQMKSIVQERRKCEHELIRGIYLLIYGESLKLGLTHWYAVMAKGLQVILSRWGIPFEQIGPAREYHGVRAPYILSIRKLEDNLEKKKPDLLKLARQEIAGG